MVSRETTPDWLARALARREVGRVRFLDEEDWFTTPAPGELRVARPMDESPELVPRLVLVFEAEQNGDPWVNVFLVAESVDVSTNSDIRLQPDETSLPFAILIETDVVGPLFAVQLGPSIGRVSEEVLAELHSELHGRMSDRFAVRRGLALQGRADPRWQWKNRELSAMQMLGYPCIEVELRVEATPVLIDPAVISSLEDEPEPKAAVVTLLQILVKEQGAAPGTVSLLPDSLWTGEKIAGWVSHLDPDSMRALEPTMIGALRPGRDIHQGGGSRWRPTWPTAGREALTREIAACAARGARLVRVVTRESALAEHRISNAIALHLEGIGIVQVTPEFIAEGAA